MAPIGCYPLAPVWQQEHSDLYHLDTLGLGSKSALVETISYCYMSRVCLWVDSRWTHSVVSSTSLAAGQVLLKPCKRPMWLRLLLSSQHFTLDCLMTTVPTCLVLPSRSSRGNNKPLALMAKRILPLKCSLCKIIFLVSESKILWSRLRCMWKPGWGQVARGKGGSSCFKVDAIWTSYPPKEPFYF